MSTTTRCLQCHDGVLKSWAELNDEEREVVKRLPVSAEYSVYERERLFRWCVRCWHQTPQIDLRA